MPTGGITWDGGRQSRGLESCLRVVVKVGFLVQTLRIGKFGVSTDESADSKIKILKYCVNRTKIDGVLLVQYRSERLFGNRTVAIEACVEPTLLSSSECAHVGNRDKIIFIQHVN